jgi:hypothetical protein
VSYQEYLDQLKKKNENLKEIKYREPNPNPVREDVLKISPTESEDVEYQNWLNAQQVKKKKEKVKEKKPDEQEEQLNRLVSERLTISNEDKFYDRPRYDKTKEKESQFQYQHSKGREIKSIVHDQYGYDRYPNKQ